MLERDQAANTPGSASAAGFCSPKEQAPYISLALSFQEIALNSFEISDGISEAFIFREVMLSHHWSIFSVGKLQFRKMS